MNTPTHQPRNGRGSGDAGLDLPYPYKEIRKWDH